MKTKTEKRVPSLAKFGLTLAFTAVLAACGQVSSEQNPSIVIDGSSTVYPITEAIAREFKATKGNQVDLQVNFSGTTGGFKKFCAGQTQINDASRPISTAEMAACKQARVAYIELPIAFDAITVAVNPQNDWLDSITVDQFIYVNSSALQKNPLLKEFVEFYLDRSPEIVSSVGYIPLPEEGYQLTNIHFHRGKVGTVFEGKSALNLTIGELLRKQAKF